MDQDGPGWTRMDQDQDGPGWTRMDQDGPGWTRMDEGPLNAGWGSQEMAQKTDCTASIKPEAMICNLGMAALPLIWPNYVFIEEMPLEISSSEQS